MWTPWRLRYITGERSRPECVFCAVRASDDDLTGLVLLRGVSCFVMLNLFPYNTGHLMLLPNAHIQDPDQWDTNTGHEISDLLARLTGTIRRVQGCDGINIGMNLGEAAGAGIAEHLHQHFVPRWFGDANFMPITAATKVLPELLAATYGKFRAEFSRQQFGHKTVTVMLLDPGGERMLTLGGRLPSFAVGDEAVWRTATVAATELVGSVDLVCWGGAKSVAADQAEPPAIVFRAASSATQVQDHEWTLPGEIGADDLRAVTGAMMRAAS